MAPVALRVIKLGGSLLDWQELPIRFRRWLAVQPPAANVIIGGGGPIVEGLRTIDRVHRLSIEASHWLAIRAMGLTAAVVAELLPEAELVESLAAIRREPGGPVQLLDAEGFLREEQGRAGALPCGWDVTSDSIAARVASTLDARELVLLKSAIPLDRSRDESTLIDAVDAYFFTAASGLSVRLVNLRSTTFEELHLDPP